MNSFVKRIVLTVFVLFAIHSSAQQEIHFDERGYQTALNISKSEHKPILYFVYASWCPHCNKMKSEVFKDAALAEFLNANFVCAAQDIDKSEGEFFKQKFGIKAFPTFLVIDERGNLLYHFNGEYKTETFLAELKNALNPEKQLPFLLKQFKDDPANGTKCLDFLTTLKKGADRTKLNPYAQQYLATQTDAQLVSEINWRIIANGVSDIESRPFQYVLQHQDAFAKVASPKRVQKKMVNIITELLQPYTEKPDTLGYFQKRAIASGMHLQKTDSLIFRYDLTVAEKSGNWQSYKKIAKSSAQQYVWNDAKMLKEIAQVFLLHAPTTDDLKFAIQTAERSAMISDTYETAILAARLYQKDNDLKSAQRIAEKARKRNADVGFNTREADELLRELAQNKIP